VSVWVVPSGALVRLALVLFGCDSILE